MSAALSKTYDPAEVEDRLYSWWESRNLFDAKPRVRDSSGEVPFSYQPDLLDPRRDLPRPGSGEHAG